MDSDSATVAREEAQDCSCQAGRGSTGTYPSAMRVLLTGMSGSGKSTLVQELRRRGYAAYDADDDGFSEPRASGPRPAGQPRGARLVLRRPARRAGCVLGAPEPGRAGPERPLRGLHAVRFSPRLPRRRHRFGWPCVPRLCGALDLAHRIERHLYPFELDVRRRRAPCGLVRRVPRSGSLHARAPALRRALCLSAAACSSPRGMPLFWVGCLARLGQVPMIAARRAFRQTSWAPPEATPPKRGRPAGAR